MSKFSILLMVGLWLVNASLLGQNSEYNNDPVLFTYGDHEVTKSEFKYVFEKNNPEIENPTVQDLQDYLDLYKKFKVKVAAAEAAHIDTVPSVRNDLKNYLDQLYNSYLDKVVLQPLLDELEERWKVDVRSKHILVSLPKGASAEDSAKAYDRIMDIRKRIVNGEDFSKVALQESDDKYVENNEGDLGYMQALKLPYYEFENKLYNTEVGEVSMPVRTRMGFHIIMPTDRREAVGTVEVAHILSKLPKNPTEKQVQQAREKINKVYEKLKAGGDFGKLAREYSDDQMTKTKGGVMQPFSAGQMVAPFESAAFSLEGDSSFTEPFRTRYGFHILMLLDKNPKTPFDKNEGTIKRKVKNNPRYKIKLRQKMKQFMSKYGYKEYDVNFSAITAMIDSGVYRSTYFTPDLAGSEDARLFSIGDNTYKISDLLKFIERNQRYNQRKSFSKIVTEGYSSFRERMIMEVAFRDMFPDYPKLKKEYRDGIMMFAMMQDSVWNHAMQDTAGLEKYYEAHKGEYMWEKRADATVFYINSPEKVKLKRLKRKAKRNSKEELYKMYNDSAQFHIQIDSFLVEQGVNDLVDTVKWKKGWSEKLPNPRGDGYALVKIDRVVPPQPKMLSEARGAYIADYQSKLEKEWVATLLERYPVKVNKKVLRSLAE